MNYNGHLGIYVYFATPVEDKSKSLLLFLSSPKILPDESEAEFQSGLQSHLSELDPQIGVASIFKGNRASITKKGSLLF